MEASTLHLPVMLDEVVRALRPHSGGCYLDGTLGYGGHASEVLSASNPDGRLYGTDRDDAALEVARRRLEGRFGAERVDLRHGSFAELEGWIEPGSLDGAMMDLGVSSVQFDQGDRGFSFRAIAPLDMRMDRRQSLTAEEIINEWDGRELTRIFRDLGGESRAKRAARAVERRRRERPFETTTDLAGFIESVLGRRGAIHPATKVFQALRIQVNDELEQLAAGLEAVFRSLAPGGRLVVISFHSGEDRIVKEFGRRLARGYEFDGEVDVPEMRRPRPPLARLPNRKPLVPTSEETRRNPRARSAKMRVIEKI